MIYLVHLDGAFAACEDAKHAERYEARGYTRRPYAEYRTAWQAQDEASYARLRAEAKKKKRPPTLEEQTETAPLKPGTIKTRLEGGVMLYTPRGRP